MIPDKIVLQYILMDIAITVGWVYMEIHKGMYSLIANHQLKAHLTKYGYYPTPRTTGSLDGQRMQPHFLLSGQ
jgi:hypothetical protein